MALQLRDHAIACARRFNPSHRVRWRLGGVLLIVLLMPVVVMIYKNTANTGVADTGTCVKSWRLHSETCQAGVEAAKSFEKVYDSGFWQSKGTASDFKKLGPQFYYHDSHQAVNGRQCLTFRQSLSGTGSNKGVASSRSLKYLAKAVIENKITSVLDAPCGDANWQFDDFATDSLPVYYGHRAIRDQG